MDEGSDPIQVQNMIRQNQHDMKAVLNDLKIWESEIKKEERLVQNAEPDQVVPKKVRSHMFKENGENNLEKSSNEGLIKKESDMHAKKLDLEKSNKWKEAGNNHVRLGEFEKAVDAYTKAIALYDRDPNYYANRALCHLRLERYHKCIEDCRLALDLDPLKIKALYRMMQAYEALCEVETAVEYCIKVLKLDPSNKEAQKSLQRLEEKRRANKKDLPRNDELKSDAVWSRMESKKFERIKPVVKPLHKRSQLPLKRIKILETPEPSQKCDENKCSKNSTNYVATTQEKTQVSKTTEDVNVENVKQANKIGKFIAPSSSSHFYSTWKELVSDEEKFAYLNFIGTKNLNRILGACFDYDTLSEIIVLLDKFCTADRRRALDLLIELSKHDQVRILSMFLSTEDLQALQRLVSALEEEGLDIKDSVQQNFCLNKL